MTLAAEARSEPYDYAPDASKITHPTIYALAMEYADSGVPEMVADVLSRVPQQLRQPLRYTFANHVTKERPLTVLHVAEELAVKREKALGVAACTDVLWNTAIIIDDMYDKDATNAGQRPSAWVHYGKRAAFMASAAAVRVATAYTARNYGVAQAYDTARHLRRGVASLTGAKAIRLDGPLEDYYRNYDMRASFYTVLPLNTLARCGDVDPAALQVVQRSLLRMNRAGQMINDLQDFNGSANRQRQTILSDVRGGTATVPLRHIWRNVGAKTQQRLAGFRGATELSDADQDFMLKLAVETGVGAAVCSLIEREYCTAREEYNAVLKPSTNNRDWLDAWLAYKLEQARTVVGTH